MAVGLLLLTHATIGQAMIDAAKHVLPELTLDTQALSVPDNAPVPHMHALVSEAITVLNNGHGVLVLSDVYGATPCNIGLKMNTLNISVRCVSGLNLPMLLRVLNYADHSLDQLADIAAQGGHKGIIIDHD